MKDVAGRTLTNYFGPDIETPALGRISVVGGTGNTRIYQTAAGKRFSGPANASPWGIEHAAMRAGVLADPMAADWPVPAVGPRRGGRHG